MCLAFRVPVGMTTPAWDWEMTAMMSGKKISVRSKPRQSKDVDVASAVFDDGKDTQIVGALSRGLMLLDAFRRSDVSLGNAELAERTGLTKPTVSRLAYTLARHNYLIFDPHRREYRLGVGAVSLGAVALAMTNVRTTALPLMRSLAEGCRFNVGLGTRSGRQMVYTDACEGGALVGLRLLPGARIPIATTAMGRAYLASLDEPERAAVLADLRTRYDDDWASVRSGVNAAVEALVRDGYCCSIGDWQKDINGIAVPIAAPTGEPTYVLNLGGPAYALSEEELRQRLAPLLIAVAREVEAALDLTDGAPPQRIDGLQEGKEWTSR